MGVGIVAEMAVRDDPPGGDLVAAGGPPVRPNTSRVAFKRGAYLRHFVFAFAELLSDRLTRPLIEKAMAEAAARPRPTNSEHHDHRRSHRPRPSTAPRRCPAACPRWAPPSSP
jgi:hypothetical protein